MVTAVTYPNCCGALVFQGFRGTDEEERAAFIGACIASNNRMKWSFVMNDDQIRRYPLTLAEAHRVGFVLSASWVNYNHNSQLYEFERCGERLTLNSAAEKINWPGRVKTPNLGGAVFNGPESVLTQITRENTQHIPTAGGGRTLPYQVHEGDYLRIIGNSAGHGIYQGSIVRVSTPCSGNTFFVIAVDSRGQNVARLVNLVDVERVQHIHGRPAAQYYNVDEVMAGDIVRVTNPRSRNFNRELRVLRVVTRQWDSSLLVLDGRQGDGEQRLVATSCVKVRGEEPAWIAEYETIPFREQPVAAAEPPFVPPFQEINLVGEEEQWRAIRPAPAADPIGVGRRIIHQAYHARYRDDRIGAGYDTLEALREANPRVTRYIRKDIFNTIPFTVEHRQDIQ